jgi:hypothetical protein
LGIRTKRRHWFDSGNCLDPVTAEGDLDLRIQLRHAGRRSL